MALCIPSLQAINCISAVNVLFGLETAVADIPDTIPRLSLVRSVFAIEKSLGGHLWYLRTSRRRFGSGGREAMVGDI
jgi:hypothetical protein